MTELFLLSCLAGQSVFTRVAWWSRQMADGWSLTDKVWRYQQTISSSISQVEDAMKPSPYVRSGSSKMEGPRSPVPKPLLINRDRRSNRHKWDGEKN